MVKRIIFGFYDSYIEEVKLGNSNEELPLAGKNAWITGSSRGIGRVIAEHLAGQGASVAVHGTGPRSTRAFDEAESLQAVADSIAEEKDARVISVWGDLTKPKVVEENVSEIQEEFEQIDILVNCAGGDIGSGGTSAPKGGKPPGNDAVNISVEDIRAVLDRNLMTCILCSRQVAPAMMERESGWIVNIGSIAGLRGRGHSAIYATAKAGVHQYSRCLADMMRPYNVRVNVVAPGEIVTPRFKASREIDEGRVERAGSLEAYGRPIDVARTVGFLLTEDSNYITGQVIRVDGGVQCWPA